MNHRYLHTVVVLVVTLALVSSPVAAVAVPPASHPAPATAAQAGLSDRAAVEAWLDETMADQLERYHVPGAAVVIVRDGEPFVAKGYGYADVDAGTPVDPDTTVFRIGSTGKLLTWTAVVQGVEDGRLALDRDVNGYLTDSPVAVPATDAQPVTLEHLGTHTAGFEDSFAGVVVDTPADVRPLGDALAAHQPARVRPPGEFVAYSNYGTALAGHVVAEQYDTTFTAYVDERIFTPLGMADSAYDQPAPTHLASRLAVGYTYQDGEYRAQPPVVWGMAPEGGSLLTTGADMSRFMLAHLNDGEYAGERILAPESVRSMHERHFARAPAVPELNGMAYGFIEMDRNDERIVGHWGTAPQFGSLLALFPERDVGVFYVYNAAGGHAARFAFLDAFVDRYYPGAATPPAESPAGAAERAARLTGDYRSLTISESSWERILGVLTRTYTVSATDDGHLTTAGFGEETRQWVERDPGVYQAVDGDELLVFRTDEAGQGTHMFRGNFGSSTYERVPWTESQTVLYGVVGGAAIALVSLLVVWGGGFAYRRLGDRDPQGERERAARWLLGVTSLLWLAVLVVFVLAWINFNAEAASPSLALRVGTVLPYVALLGTVGAVGAAALAWRDGYWSRPVRLHYSVVTVAAVLLAWQLSLLRVLPL